MRQALVIFAKVPIPGRVKTRLVPQLNYAQAAELQKCFLQDTLDLAGEAKDCDLIIAYTPPKLDSLKALITSQGLKFIPQRGRNLGERMRNAFQDVFKSGYGSAVIIGTDLPTLPLHYLNNAFDLLGRCDIVIGPNVDGGYYLIGMRSSKKKDIPWRGLFSGISWSTEKVLRQTIERINKSRLTLGCLDVWYDVDTPASLRFLKSHIEYLRACGAGVPKRTYKFLKRLSL